MEGKSKFIQKMKVSVMVTLIFAVTLGGSLAVKADEEELVSMQKYEYPVTPEDDAWDKLESVEEKISACRIPQSILENMTDEQLLQAILDFPFWCDVFVYSSREEGVCNFEEICDAYAELVKRESAVEVLKDGMTTNTFARSVSVDVQDEINNEILSTLILYQNDFQEELTMEEIQEIAQVSSTIEINMLDEKASASTYATYTIKTPNGTAVPYITRACSHSTSSYHKTIDKQVADTYGVSIVSYGSCKYNCHSYAWYSQSTSNSYWINNPSVYMTDGSYSKVASGLNTSSSNVASGDRVFYGTTSSPSHSGIFTSSATGEPIATRTVKSKWGECGVFKHSVSNVPSIYDLKNISAWHR